LFFDELQLPQPLDEATDLLLNEIRSRLRYVNEVGLGYLTLDRQSRTLSGGEVQRINLTTALGTSLVNTLFVLDEPSIGLHPRDMKNIIKVMHKLRDSGNSLIVVEHDPQIMFTADRILDMGPGPGEHGGQAVFFGSPKQLLSSTRSVTGQYLTGKKSVTDALPDAVDRQNNTSKQAILHIKGAAEHNLKNIDVKIPLHKMVCVTGVSGSGKSTLIQDICYHALRKLKGKPVDMPGEHRGISGHELITEVILVDQSPIGKTTRSNPASYVGALDGIRKLFAAEPLAMERNYTAGTFSFNSGNGRCPTCSGNGFEHVEMQFLSDVYIRCPDCNGKRYRREVLEVKLLPAHYHGTAKSMADVLDLTVTEAIAFFREHFAILAALQPLQDVGLGYVKLGQPVPTLSGGEAQRLKLAGQLAKSGSENAARGNLLLFDEPTTGLHFEDIGKLLRAFRQLIALGHSLVIIEHNLDVIWASDWIIDLGPEGGDQGGELVCEGTPQQVRSHKLSHTAAAMRDYKKALQRFARSVQKKTTAKTIKKRKVKPAVEIHKAREHNLQNVDINIPREKFTVVTGVSGSGKSTVAFDILFAEGQRRYLESLNAYARQFVQPSSRPDVDAVFGIPPTVAIEQRTSRGGRKSTVATMTEIYHFLRLLFVKLGTQYCPDCDIPIEPQSPQAIHARILRTYRNKSITLLAPLVVSRKGYYTDLAKWAAKKGFTQLRVDGQLLDTDPWPRLDRFKEHTIDLPVAGITVSPKKEAELYTAILRALDYGKGVIHVILSSRLESPTAKREIYSSQRACPGCGRSFEELDPRLFSYNSKHGWCESCLGTGVELQDFDETQTGEEWWWQESDEQKDKTCAACEGQRLRPEALAVRFKNQSIAQLNTLAVAKALKTFAAMKLNPRETDIAHSVIQEIISRLQFLQEVGLAYLSLDRSAPTLSGGEAQRIRLAAQLGSNLRGVCYILDEPTIGLHPRDNTMLLNTLAKLEGKGNTIVVVEHDEDTIRRAEHIIDLGPGAGVNGGRLVAQGSINTIMRCKQSLTGQFLANPLRHPLLQRRHTQLTGKRRSAFVEIQKARLNNLKIINAKIPTQRLVCVTGVSGSGKSTLIRQVLHENLKTLLATSKRKSAKTKPLRGCSAILGADTIGRLLEVDQTPIGKTPRSCPATYIGFWDNVRRMFAETPEARMRGYTASRFSFNVAGGRCDACEGQGYKKIEMSFLPDVKVPCDVCNGARFNQETLSILYKGKNIGEVLAMSIEEATDFFAALPNIHKALQLLQDVGLGYLTLGQQSPTLSGGEAQRIKLVTELAKAVSQTPLPDISSKKPRAVRAPKHTLYILDEPTIGLHMADVEKLIRVLHRLVDAGNSVVVIEHNLDVIAEADWIIDLGPEGGDQGGRIVAQGTPETIVKLKRRSQTANSLAQFLKER
jgi:excinuclease ABC subunit A